MAISILGPILTLVKICHVSVDLPKHLLLLYLSNEVCDPHYILLPLTSTRTLVLPKVFPWISHDFWDGPYGCVLVGSIMAGSSIWIENGRRRGEMALYVLPKAVRSILPNRWLRSGRSGVLLAERYVEFQTLATRTNVDF